MTNLKDLAKPFPAQDIEWRVGRAGLNDDKPWAMVLAYINARAIMDRLDETVGPENWRDRYWAEGKAIMCGLSIKIGEEWIEKVDGAEATDIEPVKGGLSNALKRAAVKWGIGRYLYKLEEGFAQIVEKSREANYARGKDKHTNKDFSFYWLPPQLPDWALPENAGNPPAGGRPASGPSLKAVPSDPSQYVIPFGQKYIGKRLEEIGPHDANNYANWLKASAKDKNKPLTGDALEAVNAIEAFCKSRETPRPIGASK